MTEREKIQYAKTYVEKLAKGINPLTGESVPEGDTLGQERIQKCLSYVSEVLQQVIDRGSKFQKSAAAKKLPFAFPIELRAQVSISDRPITVSEIVDRINGLVDLETHYPLRRSQVTSFLLKIGALEEITRPSGITQKRPTQQGRELGISTECRRRNGGFCTAVVYDRNAQQFLLDNLETFLLVVPTVSPKRDKRDYEGQPWTAKQEERLTALFRRNVPIPKLAVILMRSEEGVRARLKKLGLIEY